MDFIAVSCGTDTFFINDVYKVSKLVAFYKYITDTLTTQRTTKK